MVDGHRRHLEARDRERHARFVLGDFERPVEHVLAAQHGEHGPKLLPASRRQPELGPRQRLARIRRLPQTHGTDRPMVEMEVRDRDRVDRRPRLALAQLASTPGPQSSSRRPRRGGTGPAGVGPGGRRADDGDLHRHVLADAMARKIRVVIAKPGGRSRPWWQDHREGAPRRRHGGHLHRLHQTPEQIVETAIQEDADAVGISILSGAHMTLVPRILEGRRTTA